MKFKYTENIQIHLKVWVINELEISFNPREDVK